MPLILRSAGLNDIPAILALERGASGAVHWNSEQYERLVSSGMVLAAEENGELCGFICAGAAAGEWEIENVVVGSGFLRRGIGDALMRELIGGLGMRVQRQFCWRCENRMRRRGHFIGSMALWRRGGGGCITTFRKRTLFCTSCGSAADGKSLGIFLTLLGQKVPES